MEYTTPKPIDHLPKDFPYHLDFDKVDFRLHPELYKVGRGEMGVLSCQPYKAEILPFWRFKNKEVAQVSADKIYDLFLEYKTNQDFIGMDMARKYIQMGYTRSRRYCNHKGGKKYDGPVPEGKKGQSGSHGREELPRTFDQVKADAAQVFYDKWQIILQDKDYVAMRQQHKERYG